MNCEGFRKLMPGLQEDALSSRDNEALAAHLRDCPDCRRELQLLSDSLDLFCAASPSGTELPPYFASRIAARAAEHARPRNSILSKLAAGLSALAVIAAVFIAVALRPKPVNQPETGVRAESINFQSQAMGVEIEKNKFVLHSRDNQGKEAVDLNL